MGNHHAFLTPMYQLRLWIKNDNAPIFCENAVCDNSPKSIVVFEEYPVQSVVTLMSAVDADIGQNAAITYRLLGQ